MKKFYITYLWKYIKLHIIYNSRTIEYVDMLFLLYAAIYATYFKMSYALFIALCYLLFMKENREVKIIYSFF